jgi:hypothetical protein
MVPADQSARIAAWETHLGQRIPTDYRAFLIRYDGGFPYPNVFEDVTPDAVRRVPDKAAICDRLYGLDLAKAETDGATFGKGVPPGYALIGQDPGGLILLLSLRAGNAGAIHIWQSTSNIWGTDGNDESRVFKQADSFTAFLGSLFDTSDKVGYDYWATPSVLENAVELNLR